MERTAKTKQNKKCPEKQKLKLREIYKRLSRAFGPQHWWPGETPFEVAIGAVLTQNTNWGNVEKAIRNLKEAGTLSAPAIDGMPRARLAELIRPSGYFNVKAVRVKALVSFILKDFGGDIAGMGSDGGYQEPRYQEMSRLREKFLAVNGIGPETADSILLYALEMPVFVIDAYTKRILARHGIASPDWDYGRLQELFHGCLKPDVKFYNEYHALLVAAGKRFCRPRSPFCGACPLAAMEPPSFLPGMMRMEGEAGK